MPSWKLITLIALLVSALHAPAQDLSTFRKVLFPSYVPLGQPLIGVNGSTFSVSALQYSEEPFLEFPAMYPGTDPSTVGLSPAGATPIRFAGPASAGRVAFIESEKYDEVSFGTTLLASTQDGSHSLRTTLPVVRDEEFGTRFRFMPLPLIRPGFEPTRFRNTMRLYSLGAGDVVVRVKVLVFHTPTFQTGTMTEAEVAISARDAADPTYPWYAQVSLHDLFPSEDFCLPFSANSPCPDFDFIVEAEQISGSAPFWGFITLTENATQHTTVITPE